MYTINTFLVINTVSMIMAGIPWGLIPHGNIPLQKLGIAVQMAGFVLMLSNFVAFFILL